MDIKQLNSSKVPIVRIDPALNKYAKKVLFPDKVAKANEVLKKVGLPKPKPTT
ncbi:hypothetical protein ACFP2F_12040 [Hymenobacter artigasi]|uniref:Uncharacterized protein n=1 Tax=Hymenobacter artigasi TaxID=2719616 RepID=A0ABX1HKB3_9BACT|nr:hypothetical protein [Hymenobacter artigasi]NKI89441.1 hypothetical protein [Hymenobacter artigasi]